VEAEKRASSKKKKTRRGWLKRCMGDVLPLTVQIVHTGIGGTPEDALKEKILVYF